MGYSAVCWPPVRDGPPDDAAEQVADDEEACYPGALLQRGADLGPGLLQLRDEDGGESHGEARTQPRQVGHHARQHLHRTHSDSDNSFDIITTFLISAQYTYTTFEEGTF